MTPHQGDVSSLLPLWEEQYRLHSDRDAIYYVPWTKTLKNKIENYLMDAIQTCSPHILAAKVENKFVGFITYDLGTETYFDTKITRFGSVIEIIVSEKYRGQGIEKNFSKPLRRLFLDLKDLMTFDSCVPITTPKPRNFINAWDFIPVKSFFIKREKKISLLHKDILQSDLNEENLRDSI